MKKQKPPAREPVQLHIDPTPAETTPEYTLEDIMNEFGGWTKREPGPAAVLEAPEPPKPEKPEETPTPETSETPEAAPQEAEAVRPAEPAPKEDKQPDLSAQTMRLAPVTAEPPKPEPDLRIIKRLFLYMLHFVFELIYTNTLNFLSDFFSFT